MTENKSGCTCASFFTIRGKHKATCPARCPCDGPWTCKVHDGEFVYCSNPLCQCHTPKETGVYTNNEVDPDKLHGGGEPLQGKPIKSEVTFTIGTRNVSEAEFQKGLDRLTTSTEGELKTWLRQFLREKDCPFDCEEGGFGADAIIKRVSESAKREVLEELVRELPESFKHWSMCNCGSGLLCRKEVLALIKSKQ